MDAADIARQTASALFPARARDLTGHLVAILPGQDAEGLAHEAASVLGCGRYMAAQILRRPVPPIARFDGELEAAAYEGSLQRVGVDFVSFAEARLNEVLEPRRLHDF